MIIATTRLQAQLAESKAEIRRLKELLSAGVHRDLCLILTPNRRGLKSGIPQIKFLSSIEKFKDSFYASLREGHRPNSTADRAYAAHYVHGQRNKVTRVDQTAGHTYECTNWDCAHLRQMR
jgi:hypothetical protein